MEAAPAQRPVSGEIYHWNLFSIAWELPMCGRFAQSKTPLEYAAEMGWHMPDPYADEEESDAPAYNIPPGSAPLTMRRLADDSAAIERIRWGYRPSWAADKGLPEVINARLEKASASPYFRPLWRAGRIIVPADGWYEWTGSAGHKQPWYISMKSDRPLFMAGLAHFASKEKEDSHAGFVILTAAADAGLLDIHDRRPVVLEREDAELWMDPALSVEQAERLARFSARPAEDFKWHAVSREVNRVGRDDPKLIEPVNAG